MRHATRTLIHTLDTLIVSLAQKLTDSVMSPRRTFVLAGPERPNTHARHRSRSVSRHRERVVPLIPDYYPISSYAVWSSGRYR